MSYSAISYLDTSLSKNVQLVYDSYIISYNHIDFDIQSKP